MYGHLSRTGLWVKSWRNGMDVVGPFQLFTQGQGYVLVSEPHCRGHFNPWLALAFKANSMRDTKVGFRQAISNPTMPVTVTCIALHLHTDPYRTRLLACSSLPEIQSLQRESRSSQLSLLPHPNDRQLSCPQHIHPSQPVEQQVGTRLHYVGLTPSHYCATRR